MSIAVCQSVPYSSQADMWSLGCVLYELCTLTHAFAADSLYSLIFRIINGTYEPIDSTRYSPQLSCLVSSLLDKDPNTRPSCRALLGDVFVNQHIEKTMLQVPHLISLANCCSAACHELHVLATRCLHSCQPNCSRGTTSITTLSVQLQLPDH
jgi:serine/threonine protein kinase